MLPHVGDRIQLVEMGCEDDGRPDPHPIPSGAEGTVEDVSDAIQLPGDRRPWHQISVTWDSGRTLALVTGKDRFRIVAPAERVLRCLGPGCRATAVTQREGEYAEGWVEIQFWQNAHTAHPGGLFHDRDCLERWLAQHPRAGRPSS